MGSYGAEWNGYRTAPGKDISLQGRLELMDAAGIERQVLCVGAHQPYLADGGVRRRRS
ncbi:MAG TPA: hypothetical protein VK009_18095 [Chloroflexota bacterium]|nr:hypothetical protein [Chloroflexota bacterium]